MATKYAFFEGKIVPIDEAKISIMTHALNYGTGCFEGIRAYWNETEGQLFVFKMREHYERLERSCNILLISLPWSVDDLCNTTIELLRKEGFREDAYIRPLAYKAEEGIGVRLHDVQDQLSIFATPFGEYIDKKDAKVMVSSWRRINDNSVPARAKISGAYVNSALIKTDAILNGFDEAIVLTQQGHVSEGSAENLFILRAGKLVTSPVTDDILEGITRRSILELAERELGLTVSERPIDRTEIYLCDEFFMTGTAAQVTAVTRVDYRPIGTGHMGSVTARLRELYADVVRGKLPKYRHWNTAVYTAEGEIVSK